MDNIRIPLLDQTGLDRSKYEIYVLGFSSTSKKQLYVAGDANKKGLFTKITEESGSLPAYSLIDEIFEIDIDATTQPLSEINGARIYFFVSEKSKFPNPPVVKYTNYGASVTNVQNPPNTDVAPYTFAEFSLVSTSYGAVIDSQTVDGFVFPLTISLNDDLGAIGQPSNLNRQSILKAYAPFMTALGSEGTPFADLQYTENSGGLLNPGAYLNDTSSTGNLNNLDSALNNLFDDGLNHFFARTDISIQGVSSGTIAADIYNGVPATVQLPNSSFTHGALQFTGVTNGTTYTVFNPVDLCVLNYKSGTNFEPIIGSINGTTLTFTNPLPSDTPLLANMYVQGAGVNPGITIVSITKNGSNEIASVELSGNLGIPAANSQYRFSKVSNMFYTSGNMVFANLGVFADPGTVVGEGQDVILNLQNQIVCAFNRGVASMVASTTDEKKAGGSTLMWGTETNWYPSGQVQNLFSLFMHTGTAVATGGSTQVPIFLQPKNPANSARGTAMGQAYGFAYDENPGPVPPAPTGQPEVPSKYDPLSKKATTITITLGAWS